MVMLPAPTSLTCSGNDHYKELWRHLKAHFDRITSDTNGDNLLNVHPTDFDLDVVLKLLISIKNSLVGSRTRKFITMNDSQIISVIPVLACILELTGQQITIMKLKIEAAAVVGLLCLPEDQTVLGLLRARLPGAIIHALTSLLSKSSIETIIFHPTPTNQTDHHFLKTLLRTLSSLYGVIQDVSSSRKWGYMTKSPERVHQSKPGPIVHPLSQPVSSSSPPGETDRFDLKGKARAIEDATDEMFIDPLTSQHLDAGETDELTRHFWLISKRNEIKESCEHAKVQLLKFLAQDDLLISLILTISPPSNQFNTPDPTARISLCATADLVVPCLQLIWLLCKDTRRQVWFVRQLMKAQDPIKNEESRLQALVGCLKAWLASNHDGAVESSIRVIGALLSINDPPHWPEDHDLSEYLDSMIWGKFDTDEADDSNSWGIGWVLLTCRAKDGSPALRAALATSSVCLVKNFPDIRLRILKLQIHNAITLIDNPTHSVTVRAEAAYALAHAVTVSEALQIQATEAGVIPVLKKLLDKASEPPVPYPTPAISAQNAMLRESAYLALASLMSTLDQPRQEVIDLNLLPSIVKSLGDDSVLVRASACQCCRALSRAISVLRTKLADEGAGPRLFDLAFGAEGSHEIEESSDDDEDEDAVEIQLKTVAMGALCNLVLDFSPMKQEVLNRNGIEKFVKSLKSTKHQSLRVSALWGLKNMTFSSSTDLKLKVIGSLGWDVIHKLLEDKNPSIQENIISLLRNVVCGDVADIDIVFRQLNTHDQLMALLEDRLSTSSINLNTISSSSMSESIILQTIYTISNIATGTEAHKLFILSRHRTMNSIYELMSHKNSDIKIGAIWCVNNLSHWDEGTDSENVTTVMMKFTSLGIINKLNELSKEEKLDVSGQAKCALTQIRKRRKS
ncbi:armadillo-type protein [Melampsora americana]|nr:armadillo-type protein [Melampsora americana]